MGNDEAALVRLSTSATLRLGIPQPYSWSTSLGINELYACGLEDAADTGLLRLDGIVWYPLMPPDQAWITFDVMRNY